MIAHPKIEKEVGLVPQARRVGEGRHNQAGLGADNAVGRRRVNVSSICCLLEDTFTLFALEPRGIRHLARRPVINIKDKHVTAQADDEPQPLT